MFSPKGIIASLVTNCAADGKLDLRGLRRNIVFQKKAGVQGVCVLGGTGEPLSLSFSERQQVMEAAAEECGDVLALVVGAMVGNPTDVIQDIKTAAKCRAKACMVISPPFVRPSEGDVERMFADLGSRTDMPLILFNVPSRSGFLMSADLILRLANKVDTIVGVKESSRDVVLLSKIRSSAPSGFSVLQGVDSLLLPSLALGGDGGLLAAAAVFPEVCVALHNAFRNARNDVALRYHNMLMPMIDLMYEKSHPAPLKCAIEHRGLPAGPTRPPLYGLTEEHADRVRKCVASVLAAFESDAPGPMNDIVGCPITAGTPTRREKK